MPTGINRRLLIEVTPSLASRFWSRVAKLGDDDCWLWTGAFRNGYGAIKHQGRVLGAHRVAYVLTYGEPPEGMIVGHKCDNRACCNPAHLEAITPGQNNRDAFARGERHTNRGEQCPGAVLTEQAVAQAWAMRLSGVATKAIAERLGVKRRTLNSVFQGKTWKHLKPQTTP